VIQLTATVPALRDWAFVPGEVLVESNGVEERDDRGDSILITFEWMEQGGFVGGYSKRGSPPADLIDTIPMTGKVKTG
jgi:hypothetical protein